MTETSNEETMTVQTNYGRYQPDEASLKPALWCLDCTEDDNYQADVRLIWVQPDEETGEPALADWMAIADGHEAKRHAANGVAGDQGSDDRLHRVTVTVENVWTGSPDAPERDIEFRYAVEHPAACDRLPYGSPCEFDLVTDHGGDKMPGHPGVYDARVVEEDIPEGVEPDLAFAEFRVDFERVQQAQDGGVS